MPIEQSENKVLLSHPKGSSAELLLYGATVVSWKAGTERDSTPVERLFVSSKAVQDGTKPVRGGIPVVFPCFGLPSHPDHVRLDQHGFARKEIWKFDEVVMDNAAGVSVRLTLEPTTSISAKYEKPFHLAFVITLAEHQLSTDLHVKNTSTSPGDILEFQALFHNYISAPSSGVLISSLQNRQYLDKTESTEQGRAQLKTETRSGVDVRSYTDSVYQDAPQDYEVTWAEGGIHVKSTNLPNVVIWNPQQEAGAKIGDMEEGGWERFVCVEPGHIRPFVKLESGKRWIGQQVLTAINGGRKNQPL
ncbi:galactose mutarotase-like protein [Coniophora puteana RWD-64-598 SS2]|uniref:Glucose-6-phosphate 1-epimerase n=1 Tax=Coniophora puteana (strain RWD-64-598) TaxID=741705 RepID=A0A5M3N5Y2_CONPW|nr:galactose mutarotase-like protein [Coniophora puteana RWD-64-598 SS2]EIW86706.1 galactose mutarotase-like protein [Coniophora puteana RWD-64-598 SS2]